MKIYFVRHATALDQAATDEERELTGEGFEEARRVGAFLKQLDIVPGAILSSPLVRAEQTATALAQALGYGRPVQRAAELANGVPREEFFRFLEERRPAGSLLLVGHAPSLPARIAVLLGSGLEDCLDMSKGSVACVEVRECGPGGGVLRWFVRQKQLKCLFD